MTCLDLAQKLYSLMNYQDFTRNIPLLFSSLWTPMNTICHTSPSLSNGMGSSGFGSKDTFKTLTAYPIAQVIIRATHNTLDHWSLNHNVTVHLSFITLYNYISAKKHNIYKQAICTCLPPGLNDAIKLVLGNKCSTCQHSSTCSTSNQPPGLQIFFTHCTV